MYHTLRWYVTDYDAVTADVRTLITDDDVGVLETAIDTDLYDRTAHLIDVDPTVVRQSIERLFV